MTRLLGVEPDCPFSPSLLKKIVYAGTQSSSFVQAAKDLHALAEVKVTAKRVERWTKRVGRERLVEVEAAAAAYAELPLPARQQSPTDQVPQVACVEMDGGRIQIRVRKNEPENDAAKGHWLRVAGRLLPEHDQLRACPGSLSDDSSNFCRSAADERFEP